MKTRYMVLFALLNFMLQTALAPFLRIYGIAPNTALILVVVIAMLGGVKKGLTFGLAAGILQDLFFSKALGVHTLIYGLLGLGVGLIENKLFKDNRLTPTVLIFGATFLFYMITYVMLYFADETNSLSYLMTRLFPLEALYNTGVCLLFYHRLFSRVYGYGLN